MFVDYKPLPVLSNNCTLSKVGNTRLYTLDKRSLPSVTSVLSATKCQFAKQAIARALDKDPWVQRVWDRCVEVGNEIHAELGNIVCSRDSYETSYFREQIATWDTVVASELTMFAPKLGVAGTLDCLIMRDGEYHLIDFKTSMKPKTRSKLGDYPVQLGFYSLMLREVYSITIATASIYMVHYDIETIETIKELVFDFSRDQITQAEGMALSRMQEYELQQELYF